VSSASTPRGPAVTDGDGWLLRLTPFAAPGGSVDLPSFKQCQAISDAVRAMLIVGDRSAVPDVARCMRRSEVCDALLAFEPLRVAWGLEYQSRWRREREVALYDALPLVLQQQLGSDIVWSVECCGRAVGAPPQSRDAPNVLFNLRRKYMDDWHSGGQRAGATQRHPEQQQQHVSGRREPFVMNDASAAAAVAAAAPDDFSSAVPVFAASAAAASAAPFAPAASPAFAAAGAVPPRREVRRVDHHPLQSDARRDDSSAQRLNSGRCVVKRTDAHPPAQVHPTPLPFPDRDVAMEDDLPMRSLSPQPQFSVTIPASAHFPATSSTNGSSGGGHANGSGAGTKASRVVPAPRPVRHTNDPDEDPHACFHFNRGLPCAGRPCRFPHRCCWRKCKEPGQHRGKDCKKWRTDKFVHG